MDFFAIVWYLYYLRKLVILMKKEESPKLNINLNPDKQHILYTDTIFINVNDDGVTMDICQKVGNPHQVHVVSRIGMSRVHANKFAKKLNEILALTMKHSEKKDRN